MGVCSAVGDEAVGTTGGGAAKLRQFRQAKQLRENTKSARVLNFMQNFLKRESQLDSADSKEHLDEVATSMKDKLFCRRLIFKFSNRLQVTNLSQAHRITTNYVFNLRFCNRLAKYVQNLANFHLHFLPTIEYCIESFQAHFSHLFLTAFLTSVLTSEANFV